MPRSTLMLLLIGGAMIAGAHGALIGVLPVLLEDQGQGPVTIGVVVGVYAVAMAAMRLVGGRLMEHLNPSRLLALAGLLMFSAFAAYLLIPPGWAMVPARLAHGAAWGLFAVVALIWIAQTTDVSNRGRLIGIYTMGTGVALVLMPATGVAIYETSSETPVFVLGLLLSLLVVVVVSSAGKSTIGADGPAGDEARAVDTAGVALGSILLVILLAHGTVGLLEAFMPTIAEERDVGSLTTVYVFFGISLGVGRAFGGGLSDRVGRLPIALAGLGAVLATFVLLNVVSGTVPLSFVSAIYGLGVGGALIALITDVADRTGSDRQGRALGMAIFLSDVGIAGGAVAGGFLASRSPGTVILGGGLLAAAAIALTLLESRRRQPQPVAAEAADLATEGP